MARTLICAVALAVSLALAAPAAEAGQRKVKRSPRKAATSTETRPRTVVPRMVAVDPLPKGLYRVSRDGVTTLVGEGTTPPNPAPAPARWPPDDARPEGDEESDDGSYDYDAPRDAYDYDAPPEPEPYDADEPADPPQGIPLSFVYGNGIGYPYYPYYAIPPRISMRTPYDPGCEPLPPSLAKPAFRPPLVRGPVRVGFGRLPGHRRP